MSNVTKIRPSWELVEEDAEGKLLFALTNTPVRDLVRSEAASKKVMKEMESRRKL